eukprot:PhM_4_TR834/c0_g1_i1/m.59589/K05236/COPA, RET1; coatomer subunit alpha
MLVKFETTSNRVKGLCFHPKRTWVLAGLHCGSVQLWDYRMGTLVEKFEEHEGPVRGIDFHVTQPLFCSGGDDNKIKVWNYKLKRCLFTLTGHLDYIRTVNFHREQPWIVSASDDQSLRIWNWQSRNCISILTGHSHYVMSAQFHPREDLVVSASLDQTLRVWDVSALRAKKNDSTMGGISQDLFSNNDVSTKQILEGHEKGVNWASFHPTRPFIVSAADDRTIRIWKMDETRAYEIEQLRGHVNNVSCVMYFKDYIVSNSEDKTIRVWDSNSRTALHMFRRDNDRYWILAAHPEYNLLAAGHDNGLVVFKLERERPAFHITNNMLYYVKDRQLKSYDFNTKNEATLHALRRHTYPPHTVQYNSNENCALFWFNYDGGIVELYSVPKAGVHVTDSDVKKAYYTSAVFVARNKYAVLDKTKQIIIKNLQNDIVKILPAVGETDKLFPGPQGLLLCRSDEAICLYDVTQRKSLAECNVSECRYAVWDPEFARVAFLCNRQIVVASRKLKILCTIQESSRVKSAAFDEEKGVLFFTTHNHMKYCLPNGDVGTLRTLDQPVYLVRARGDTVWYIGRDGKVVQQVLDVTEVRVKLALIQERYTEIFKILKGRKVHGQALVAYLQQRNYPEVAMHFVRDPFLLFNLAVECGNLEIAKQNATILNKPECWSRLADVAWKHGQVNLAMSAYMRTNNTASMCFTNLLQGNVEGISQTLMQTDDPNLTFQYSLILSDVAQQIKGLEAAGQYALALAMAKNHGLDDAVERLEARFADSLGESEDIQSRVESVCRTKFGGPLPKVPKNTTTSDWPLLPMQESYITRMLRERGALGDDAPDTGAATLEGGDAWGGDLDLDLDDGEKAADDDFLGDAKEAKPSGEIGGGEWDLDLDLDLGGVSIKEENTKGKGYIVPREGVAIPQLWCEASPLAVDHIAAGQFESGMAILRKQCGIINFEPLHSTFMHLWMGASSSTSFLPLGPPMAFHLNRKPPEDDMKNSQLPRIVISLSTLQERNKAGLAATTEGRFADAKKMFQAALQQAMFVVTDGPGETTELKEVMNVAREYIRALDTEMARKECKELSRQLELAAYFTHFNLQQTHLLLSLRSAMVHSFKAENFNMAKGFARRVLDLNPPAQLEQQARKLITSDKSTDAHATDYNERNPFTVCCVTKKPIYRGTAQTVRCSYCFCVSFSDHSGKLCPICEVGALGGEATGMVNSLAR